MTEPPRPEQVAFRRSLRDTPLLTTSGLRIDEHEPSDACADVHCWSHGVDEFPEGAWRVCFECR